MSFPRYPAYKNSGVEWLGEVPGHWEIIRLKNVLKRRITDGPHTTPEFVDDGVPFLSVDGIQDGELIFEGCRYISATDHEEYRRKALPQRDDLLMGKAASTGKIARVKVDFEFSIWSPLALIRLHPKNSSPAFYEQSLKSPIVQAQIDNLCTANTQKNISMDDIPKLILTRPPLSEQTQIATFLDRETAKIDALVAEQRRLMALLKEKRQAVISHAVTKGLNPDAPMKPSGIEWLGEVPGHWDVSAIKRYADKITDGAHVSPDTENGTFHFVSTKDVGADSIDFDNSLLTSALSYESMVKTGCRPEVGDVLFSKDGTIGRTVVIREDRDFVVASSLIIIRPTAHILKPDFLNWLCQSQSIANQVECFVKGAGLPRLSIQNLTKVVGCFPPLVEQIAIAAYLNAESAKFDTLTAEAQRAIDLLQERRTALISAAVTGQIDVRGAV
jgi:type I restriction enzyme S subunit